MTRTRISSISRPSRATAARPWSPIWSSLLLATFLAGAVSVAGLGAAASAAEPPAAPAAAAPALLPVGAPAPHFTAVAHNGEKVDLAKLKGKYVVLYFYPKDDTTGCTKEACDFRDNWATLQKKGIVVFGVSTQDNSSHQAFAQKYNLQFPLLPDDKGEIAAKYHVPLVGGLARRITYLIGKDGKIAHVWPSVNPVGHAGEILAQIQPAPTKAP